MKACLIDAALNDCYEIETLDDSNSSLCYAIGFGCRGLRPAMTFNNKNVLLIDSDALVRPNVHHGFAIEDQTWCGNGLIVGHEESGAFKDHCFSLMLLLGRIQWVAINSDSRTVDEMTQVLTHYNSNVGLDS